MFVISGIEGEKREECQGTGIESVRDVGKEWSRPSLTRSGVTCSGRDSGPPHETTGSPGCSGCERSRHGRQEDAQFRGNDRFRASVPDSNTLELSFQVVAREA